jgi:hypothetical protein
MKTFDRRALPSLIGRTRLRHSSMSGAMGCQPHSRCPLSIGEASP